jgi:hypothetical protein
VREEMVLSDWSANAVDGNENERRTKTQSVANRFEALFMKLL